MLETERFLLRPIQESDAESLFPIASDAEVTKFLRFDQHKTLQDTIDLIKLYHDHKDIAYSVIEKSTNNYVGVFCLKYNEEDPTDMVLHIYFGRQFWNKGVNSEVLKFFVENSKRLFGLKTLSGYVCEENRASSRVLEKNNFTLVKQFTVTPRSSDWNGVVYLYRKELA